MKKHGGGGTKTGDHLPTDDEIHKAVKLLKNTGPGETEYEPPYGSAYLTLLIPSM